MLSTADLPETPFEAPSLACVIASIGFTAIRTYLWPVGIVVALWAIGPACDVLSS
jgi:hypothetical protein